MNSKLICSLLVLLNTAPAFAGGSSTVGPGNPAAYACEEAGGTLVPIHSSLGEGALCQFGEKGGAVEEWTLFRSRGRDTQQAVEAFFNPKAAKRSAMGNPASLYCQAQGGTPSVETLRSGDEIGVCNFPDNSTIEEWTLFRGAADPSNAQLVNALR